MTVAEFGDYSRQCMDRDLHTETVYPPADGHSSKYKLGPVSINYVDRSQSANHYTMPTSIRQPSLHICSISPFFQIYSSLGSFFIFGNCCGTLLCYLVNYIKVPKHQIKINKNVKNNKYMQNEGNKNQRILLTLPTLSMRAKHFGKVMTGD